MTHLELMISPTLDEESRIHFSFSKTVVAAGDDSKMKEIVTIALKAMHSKLNPWMGAGTTCFNDEGNMTVYKCDPSSVIVCEEGDEYECSVICNKTIVHKNGGSIQITGPRDMAHIVADAAADAFSATEDR